MRALIEALNPNEIEIAYRIPGKTWKRKKFKTEKAMMAFLEKLYDREGDGVEVRFGESLEEVRIDKWIKQRNALLDKVIKGLEKWLGKWPDDEGVGRIIDAFEYGEGDYEDFQDDVRRIPRPLVGKLSNKDIRAMHTFLKRAYGV